MGEKDLADPTAWMRWFDFFPLYNAASEGASFVENNQFTANEAAMTDVFGLMHTLADAKVLRTGEATDPFENGDSIMTDLGPWTFPNWEEKYPELKFGENYTVTTPVVPDALADAEQVSTYADAKGIVMYAQATEEEQAAAMKFLEFVYSDENNDMKLLEMTSLIPARDDATENDAFKAYFEENPAMKVYAERMYRMRFQQWTTRNTMTFSKYLANKHGCQLFGVKKDAKTAVSDAKTAVEGALQ